MRRSTSFTPVPPMRSIWITAALSIAMAAGFLTAHAQQSGPEEEARRVALVVDYGDGCEKHFPRLDWRADMTVLDLLQVAARHPHGIQIDYRGRGPTAFLQRIDDLQNQGADGRNWVFSVNGRMATRGMDVTQLRSGDKVKWQFGSPSDQPSTDETP